MLILLFFAFLSGLVTIAAPCIWPLLPIVLSSSSLDGRRRPLGLTLGIVISFGVITLSISYLVHLVGLDASLLRTISVLVLVFMGASLLCAPITARIEGFISRFAGRADRNVEGSGFWPGFASGLPLGIVWAPCAGPILATIATLSATREVGLAIVLVTVAYLVGIAIPLLAFSYAGQHVIRRTRAFNKYTGSLQRVFGVVIIVTAGVILFNWDTKLEARLLEVLPAYSNFINDLEGNSKVADQLSKLKGSNPRPHIDDVTLFNTSEPAPELAGINRWLNLPAGQSSLTLKQLRGKVVLIDFWTYTCINCIRTLPHVTAWYDKYKDDGLVVIGVHTPEFAFEHDTSNVQRAIGQFGIRYPVAQDNDYRTWKAFDNQYWPAEYLIDGDGTIRRADFGEGDYDRTEEAIRQLLTEAGANLNGASTSTPDQTPVLKTSPETYVGGARMQRYFPSGALDPGAHADLKNAPVLPFSAFDLGGDWTVKPEYSQSGANAVLQYNFLAEHVYLVMHRPDAGNGTVRISIDGNAPDTANAGADLKDGTVTIDADRLYDLVDLRGRPGQHLLRLELSPGVQVFAFTFG